MLSKKIVYTGKFDQKDTDTVLELAGRVDIAGECKLVGHDRLELELEGDPSMIKLLDHTVQKSLGDKIQGHEVTAQKYQYYSGFVVVQ